MNKNKIKFNLMQLIFKKCSIIILMKKIKKNKKRKKKERKNQYQTNQKEKVRQKYNFE